MRVVSPPVFDRVPFDRPKFPPEERIFKLGENHILALTFLTLMSLNLLRGQFSEGSLLV